MTIRVKGLAEAIRAIQKKSKDAEKAVIDVLEDTAASIEIDAKNDAPYEAGGQVLNIKQRIDKVVENKGLTWKVGVQGSQDFDAYVEFGTGLSAKEIVNGPGYTPEMRAIAMTFYKNGLGTLVGSPYLFPNYIKHTANLVQELKDEIEKSIK